MTTSRFGIASQSRCTAANFFVEVRLLPLQLQPDHAKCVVRLFYAFGLSPIFLQHVHKPHFHSFATMVVGRFAHWPSAVFAAMIPEQLDLFGGPPRPPKRIREEEPDTSSATPEPDSVPVSDDSQMATTPIPEPAEMPMVPTAVELPEPSQDEPMPDWIVEQSALAEEEPTLNEVRTTKWWAFSLRSKPTF